MPVKKGGRLVELTPEVVEKFDRYLEEGRRPEKNFSKLINGILEDVIAKENFLIEYLPHLDAIAVKEKSVYVQDRNTRTVSEVIVENDDKVKCNTDNSDTCDHARFAMAMTEFGKIIRFKHNLQTVLRVNKEAEKNRNNKQGQNHSGSDSESISSVFDYFLPQIL